MGVLMETVGALRKEAFDTLEVIQRSKIAAIETPFDDDFKDV